MAIENVIFWKSKLIKQQIEVAQICANWSNFIIISGNSMRTEARICDRNIKDKRKKDRINVELVDRNLDVDRE